MELWMSSMPSHRSGSGTKGFWGRHKSRSGSPQATLHLDVHPPVLETSTPKCPTQPKNMDQAGGRVPGQLWNSLRSMYQSLCTGSTPPVTWVNRDIVQQIPQAPYHTTYMDPGQYLPLPENNICDTGRLWYPVPQEGQHYMDPLHVWPQKTVHYVQNVDVSQPYPYYVDIPSNVGKYSQPLNPEAKEWIPNEMRPKEKPVSEQGMVSPSYVSMGNCHPSVISKVCHDFDEIGEKEIADVRNQKENEKMTDKTVVEENLLYVNEVSQGKHTDEEIKIEDKSSPVIEKESSPVSYAVAAKKVLNPPEPQQHQPHDETDKKCIDQLIPKIFIKDTKYPKERAAVRFETPVINLPFKTANKAQKKTSKKFLDELKEMAQENSNCVEQSQYQELRSSPVCSPQWEKLKCVNGVINQGLKTQRSSSSESSSCNGRVRTNSESSIASVDSVNIEFVEDKCENQNASVTSEKCSPKCDNSKFSNNVLAHILGFSDITSETEEESDDDDDDDWDEIEADCIVIDEWETFGFGLTIPVTCKTTAIEIEKNKPEKEISCNESCDIGEEDCFEMNLEAINKHWNEEVEKNISRRTESRVKFGETKCHPMVTWAFAYQQARRGPWEQHARDSARFARHIADLEHVIAPVLDNQHREKMYQRLYGSPS